RRINDDLGADAAGIDPGTDRIDHADTVGAGDGWELDARIGTDGDPDIAAVQGGAGELDAYLSGGRLGRRDIFDGELVGSASLSQYECFHRFSASLEFRLLFLGEGLDGV